MTGRERPDGDGNPHLGAPFVDDDATIATAIADVGVPALLCSLVHMTGDPSWVRSAHRPVSAASFDLHGGMSTDDQRAVRALAVPAIAAYRDGGCRAHRVSDELALEMMAFLGCRPVTAGRLADFFLHDLQLDGTDPDAVTWGDDVAAEVRGTTSVVVIGAGMGGVLAGVRLREAGLPFTIVDANPGPGGTWWENTYPGARVDVGSHQYCYAFAPWEWEHYYALQPELRRYFAAVVDRHDLGAHCRFETRVEAITWDEGAARWRVRCVDRSGAVDVLEARFVISAVGALNVPAMPEIEGMADFGGSSFHSSRWPAGLDLTGKRLALLGAGASGFQIGPAVADQVDHLTIFQRTAQWVLPNPTYQVPVPPGEQWALRHLPYYGRWMRFARMFPGIAAGTDAHRVDPAYTDRGPAQPATASSADADPGPAHPGAAAPGTAAPGTADAAKASSAFADPGGPVINAANAQRRDSVLAWMRSLLAGRPDLWGKVVPDYPFMGKRILQDDGTWYRTLCRDDVELVRTPIERIEQDAVVTRDGTRHPVDVICYATGFRHNDFLASLEVTGRDGRSLRRQWGNEPQAHLGITVPGFPNLFMVYGPGTNLAHSSSIFLHAEAQVTYILDAIGRTLAAGAATIEVTEAAHDDYNARLQAEITQLVWAHPSVTHSHYKNPDGKVFTLSPWPVDQYWAWTRRIDPGDFVFA